MITVYHNPRCSTSRKALEFIEQHSDDEVTIIRYLDTPPSVKELRTLLADARLSAHDAIRTKEAEYKELGLSPNTPESELIKAMVTHPRLIQRPIVATCKGTRIARPTEILKEIL
ncbi:arsenate reductase (glutaredoxin) [Corynebacterium diphtheriae]|uniref:arsenate reductase (glutaredoxin) n=1 Tax=Corynebacterium diphtheriae TaxID=1717 RepID=UPI000B4B02FB|nr:arsenate reductase (glutaredoxin) [Corynebacterium diphtheriae]MBG9247891.1 arsenate reductase (glutaredoxin) [Corynebacterium diphtheriae bv. gravis]MBG9295452.1 arsenate reductase (glutaredoxin) [Corynebacterium diphtheriae bv. gravis]MBG9370850.1 arsenate reductase (glutaredoxin) [Corynebacterium diphtheriae bv. mitis]OWN43278.1 arsenate reductase [Corynebacterium diphtheriae bv. gravis]UJL49157.1 arsenate reductase (glutaredoxin) [Corynebacterium diphtheriae]